MILHMISNSEFVNHEFCIAAKDIVILWPDAHPDYLKIFAAMNYRIWRPAKDLAQKQYFAEQPFLDAYINSEELHALMQQAEKIVQW